LRSYNIKYFYNLEKKIFSIDYKGNERKNKKKIKINFIKKKKFNIFKKKKKFFIDLKRLFEKIQNFSLIKS
jgi:hypothetical protein